ncbi:protein SEMI-ROLLED LEAF 2 [Wolffia australiana]
MGFISRKVLPACVCCPALRPSSQKPVKRYKKLLAEIFPKNLEAPLNDRKILKLCEYAERNPLRLPKIAKFLEQRTYKELRCEHINFIKVIAETYCKLLCVCKEQMAYFAVSLLNLIGELLDIKRVETVHIIGCETLTTFIFSQVDGTYAHAIENLTRRVCQIAKEGNDEDSARRLKASSLECLSAMVWFMREFSHLFAGFDEIVVVALDNYESARSVEDGGNQQLPHRIWVNEVVRSEQRAGVVNDFNSNNSTILRRPRTGIRDASILTREEVEKPGVWAQICMQKIVEVAKEISTMRRILEPMLLYFDSRKQWIPDHGLSTLVLSDISHWINGSGKEHAVITAVVRHLDHKNVSHNLKLKSEIIKISAGLIQQQRSMNVIPEIGVVADLCRHLRKSLQVTSDEESALNSALQSSIQSCLVEIVKGINDAQPLFEMMALSLEELPSVAAASRATIGSLLLLSHIISLTVGPGSEMLAFPEALLFQLLKAMLHPDPETRVGTHQIFSILLVRNFSHQKQDSLCETREWQAKTGAFASAAALLEKLRQEKGSPPADESLKEKETIEEEHDSCVNQKSSSNFGQISSKETSITILSEEQTSQLLAVFWIQANQEDNLPCNFEAIAHSFSLTLLSSRLKSFSHTVLVKFFQLPLSLRKLSLESKGFSPAHLRSIFSLSTAMLGFVAKIYQVHELTEFLNRLKFTYDDPYLDISDEFQIQVKLTANSRQYNSDSDQRAAAASLSILRKSTEECEETLRPILVQALSSLTDLGVDFLTKLLSEAFTPYDELLFGPKSIFDWVRMPEVALSEESFTFEEDFSRPSSVGGDVTSASPMADYARFISKKNSLPSLPQVISVGQLLESALQVAGQVGGAYVSTSPLPYGTMARQCEALGMGTRKKFSHWLGNSDELEPERQLPSLNSFNPLFIGKERSNLSLDMDEEEFSRSDPCLALRLPPASPFDNFWKAARF